MPTLESRIRALPSGELTERDVARIRHVLDAAFRNGDEGFSDMDWRHAVGGRHFLLETDGELRGHASVVARELHVGTRALRTGYVEAVAIAPEQQRRGFGAQLMREVNAYIAHSYEIGALSTGSNSFYERLGWVTWRGPSFVRAPAGLERTAEEDGALMVLITRKTPPVDLNAPISCEWRPGDVW